MARNGRPPTKSTISLHAERLTADRSKVSPEELSSLPDGVFVKLEAGERTGFLGMG